MDDIGYTSVKTSATEGIGYRPWKNRIQPLALLPKTNGLVKSFAVLDFG